MAHNQNEYLKAGLSLQALVIKPRQHYTPPAIHFAYKLP